MAGKLTRKDFDGFARALGETFASGKTVKAVAELLKERANRDINGNSMFDADRFAAAVTDAREWSHDCDDPRALADDVYAIGCGIAERVPDDGWRTGLLAVLTDVEFTLRG